MIFMITAYELRNKIRCEGVLMYILISKERLKKKKKWINIGFFFASHFMVCCYYLFLSIISLFNCLTFWWLRVYVNLRIVVISPDVTVLLHFQDDDDFLASAPSDQQVLAQEQSQVVAVAPSVDISPLDDDEVTFDPNKVSLQVPDRLFGPSFTAVNGISLTIGNVIQVYR